MPKKPTYQSLLKTKDLEYPGDSLPFERIPEVRERALRLLHGKMPHVKRLAQAAIAPVIDSLAIAGHVIANNSARAPQGDIHKISTGVRSRMTGINKRLADRVADANGGRKRKEDSAIKAAAAEYRASHPELVRHERELQIAAVKQDILSKARWQDDLTAGYFADRNLYSFAKTIPRRTKDSMGEKGFDGDYRELARETLHGLLGHSTGGATQLVGQKVNEQLFEDRLRGTSSTVGSTAEQAAFAERTSPHANNVSTLLWQLGFVQFESEEEVPRSKGRFNPDAEWHSDGDLTRVSLPYDPNNDLHVMVAEANGLVDPGAIELSMPKPHSRTAPYMNMTMVSAGDQSLGLAA